MSFDDEGRLHLGSLEADPDPPSLDELRTRTSRLLPRVDLPEVLLEVADWTGYAGPPLHKVIAKLKMRDP